MFLYKSKYPYDQDLLDKLLQIRVNAGLVTYEEIWNTRNIVLQLMDEIMEHRLEK